MLDKSFACPACNKMAVPLLYGIINVLKSLFIRSILCQYCKTHLRIFKGTKRLLACCALLGWSIGVIFSDIFSVSTGIGIFIIFISAPAILNRKFFELL
jgi:hypothetical protein